MPNPSKSFNHTATLWQATLKMTKGVRQAAFMSGISYPRGCRWNALLNFTPEGSLRDGRLKYTKSFVSFLEYTVSRLSNLKECADFFGVTSTELSGILRTAGVKKKWNLESNHNHQLAASRRAEMFVMNMGYAVVRDCYKCREAGFQYDCILEGFGFVDVKSTIVKMDSRGNYFGSFNVQNFTPGVKYCFLVLMDSHRNDFLAVWAVPGKLVKKKSTMKIYLNPLSPKYADYLIWREDANSSNRSSTQP